MKHTFGHVILFEKVSVMGKEWNKREYLKKVADGFLESLSNEDLERIVRLIVDDNTEAIMETELTAHDPNAKNYKNFAEIMAEIREELEDEKIAEEAYLEYLRCGENSRPVSELWEELDA